jgi:HEAT repeat protein
VESEIHLPDIAYIGPNLDVPNPPPSMPYAEYEDYRCEQILEQNGIGSDEESILGALESESDVLLACAAHTAGARSIRSAASRLTVLLSSPDDSVQVESAYALARLGDHTGDGILERALERPVHGYLSTISAAGYLAQLGDPRGFAKIVEALDSEGAASKMLACKQLFFFMPFQGQIDVVAEFDGALEDPDTNIQWQALAQIRQLKSQMLVPVLQRYLANVGDPTLRQIAEESLHQQPIG